MGQGFLIQQQRRQNIAPFAQSSGAAAGDPQIVAYLDAANGAPVTGNPYYSMLPANTIDIVHPLLQDVLFGKVTPLQAARRLDASIRDEAKQNDQ